MNWKNRYFFLNRECFLIKGISAGAIYNLSTGDIYSIDPLLMKIIDNCENKRFTILDTLVEIREFDENEIYSNLLELESFDLGKFYIKKIYIEKLKVPETKQQREMLFHPPIFELLWLKICDICNLNCIHCSKKNIEIYKCFCDISFLNLTNKKSKLDLTAWKEIITDAARLRCRRIQFIGGEPLLMINELRELIIHATEKNFKNINIFTNGTILDVNLIDFLIDYNVSLKLPFYSTQEHIHDQITGLDGNYKTFMKNIEMMLNYKIDITLELLIMKQNQEYIFEAINFIKSLGIDLSNIQIIHTENKDLYPDKFYDKLFLKAGNFPNINKSQFFRFKEGNPCWDGKIAIFTDGSIHPCIMAHSENLGNVKDKSIIEVIAREKNIKKYWDLTKDKIDVCRDCEFRYACSDCRVIESIDGSLTGKNKYCTYNPSTGIWGSLKE